MCVLFTIRDVEKQSLYFSGSEAFFLCIHSQHSEKAGRQKHFTSGCRLTPDAGNVLTESRFIGWIFNGAPIPNQKEVSTAG